MIITRIPLKGYRPDSVKRQIDFRELKLTKAPLVLVPDEDTFHELQGLALIAGKELIVRVLEPGKVLPWVGSMSSPWHVNTDKYTLTFGITNELQTPHLVYAPSYLTAHK